jgi:hypothetical protein
LQNAEQWQAPFGGDKEVMKPKDFICVVVVGLGGLQMSGECRAQQIPATLRGKSVVLNWSDNRTVNDMSARQKNVDQTSEIKLYVSEQGRVFSRFERHAGRNDAKILTQVSGAPDNYLHWRFEGGSLVADQQFIKGVRRVTITFGDGFRKCSIKVLHGKELGSQAIHYRDYNTNTEYEIITIAVTATSCLVQEGNIFVNS